MCVYIYTHTLSFYSDSILYFPYCEEQAGISAFFSSFWFPLSGLLESFLCMYNSMFSHNLGGIYLSVLGLPHVSHLFVGCLSYFPAALASLTLASDSKVSKTIVFCLNCIHLNCMEWGSRSSRKPHQCRSHPVQFLVSGATIPPVSACFWCFPLPSASYFVYFIEFLILCVGRLV